MQGARVDPSPRNEFSPPNPPSPRPQKPLTPVGTRDCQPSQSCIQCNMRGFGANVVTLALEGIERGFATGEWATYRQWQGIDAQVRKGERSAQIVKWITKKLDDTDQPGTVNGQTGERRRLIPRVYAVFNAHQVGGYDATEAPAVDASGIGDWIRSIGADVIYGSASPEYAREELIAELGSAIACAHLGVSNPAPSRSRRLPGPLARHHRRRTQGTLPVRRRSPTSSRLSHRHRHRARTGRETRQRQNQGQPSGGSGMNVAVTTNADGVITVANKENGESRHATVAVQQLKGHTGPDETIDWLAELTTSRNERCWACGQHFNAATWHDRHGHVAEDPDHAEYHADCCPDPGCSSEQELAR